MTSASTATDEPEVPLTGGRYSLGVVQVGDTVRRPAKASSVFAADLLVLLEQAGCSCAPRHLGRDEHDRDILTFIPGWVPAKFQYFEDAQVAEAARMLRSLHDATRGSALAGGAEVVCHHDPGPNNTVFQDGRPVAFIDFDFAAPGRPVEDLAYLAWSWCVSSKPVRGPVDIQARQLRVLADAYGMDDAQRRALVPAIVDRQVRNAVFWQDRVEVFEGPQTPREEIEERIAWSHREARFTEDNAELLQLALTR